MYIDKKSALKSFYYLIAIDGIIADSETEQFDFIGSELLPDIYEDIKEDIIAECEKVLSSIAPDDNRYDVIIENLDEALSVKADSETNGMLSRLLMWDMLTIAYSDDLFSEDERRFTDHTARKLGIDKSIYTEMIQYIGTAVSVQKQLDILTISNRPYAEIRPQVEENEKRKNYIMKSAMQLIEDEIISNEDEKKSAEKKNNKIAEAFAEKSKNIGNKIAPATQNVGKAASDSAKNISTGAGKIFSKIKNAVQNNSVSLPEKYIRTKRKADDSELPKDAIIYRMDNGSTNAQVVCFEVSEEQSMNFEDRDGIVSELHKNMDDNSGIIEVRSGSTKKGGQYIYHILKHRTEIDNKISMGNTYTMNMNIRIGNSIQFVNCDFREVGTTGMRENIVFPVLMNKGKVDSDFKGWEKDPYDPDFKKGFLMNKSEKKTFDEQFPDHPLSELRRLAEYIIGTN